jgi:aminopeptidase N
MMRDFVATYSGKAASTEDFEAIVDKHMTPDMRAIGGGRMNWFFDEYVYGTALPSYKLESSFEKNAEGDVVLQVKLTQSNVDERFRMLVPIYLELANGRMVNLGHAQMVGNTTLEQKIPIRGLKDVPHRAVVHYYYDVLASDK